VALGPAPLLVRVGGAGPNARAEVHQPFRADAPDGYTHVVVSADGRTAYIAGQVAFDSTGTVVGGGNFQAQAEQVFANLRLALASVGASFGDVVKTTTFITDLKNLPALRETRARHFDATHPPANSLIPVTTLARPDLLLEIEAVVDMPKARQR
jgi:2-iminobutanoate/2-iminopropanoate deaminase